jgi:hypothetical protein
MEFVYKYDSESYPRTDVKLKLTKAQKLLTKLKVYVDKNKAVDFSANLYFYNINRGNIDMKKESNEIYEDIKNKNDSLNKKFVDLNILMNDFVLLKNKIHKTNSIIGLDDVLSEIEFLSQLKKNYELYLESFEAVCYKQIDVADIEYLKEKDAEKEKSTSSYPYGSSVTAVTYNTTIFDKAQINESIKKINKRMDLLETKRDYLNATSEIELSLSQTSLDVLGL